MNRNVWIGVIVVAVLVAGGWWYLNQSSTPATSETTEFPTTQQNTNTGTQPVVNTQPTQTSPQQTTPVQPNKSGWTTTTNQQLGIRFEQPADASVSSVSQKQTSDGTTINELTVTPKGMDPTVVHFFTTSASLDKAKNIQIYGFTQVKNSEFTNATIDGSAGTRRIDHYLNNDCTNELTVAEKGGVVYGFHIVQCPTHPQGYDQLRKDIADSLELL